MKNFVIILGVIVVIAAALFWREVVGIFADMTPLEAMQQIVTFILHVAVATIAAYAVATLPEFVKPWMRTFRFRQRQSRRVRGAAHSVQGVRVQGMSKLNKDKMLVALIEQLMQKQAKGGERRAARDDQENIHFDF